MKLRISTSLLAFLVLALFTITSQSKSVGASAEKDNLNSCHLIMGVSDWPPYQKLSKNGIPSGLQVDLVQQLAESVGCHLSYRGITFPEGLDELKDGTLDFMMNATASPERLEYANFSVPYRNEFLLLYSTKKYYKKCQHMTLEELILDGFKLGLQEDLVYGPELTRIQNTPELNRKIKYVKSNNQHLQLVKDKGLDGVVDDPVVVSYRSTVYITGDALKACAILVSSSPVSLIFSKKSVSSDIVNRFNQAISQIRQTEAFKKQWEW